MKYGIISYKKTVRIGGNNWTNLGDPIQSYAMVKIYEEMGISEEELVKVNRYTSRSYDGEYVILPYNCYNIIYNQDRHNNALPVSDKIIPVFVSFHLHTRNLDKELLEQLKRYEPIGCRDEETMRIMRSHRIRAYLSGCVTITLPKRKVEPADGKVFFVDCPKSLIPYVPKALLDKAEFVTHQPFIPRESNEVHLSDEEARKFYERGVQQLKEYENHASLVVTSRLHAAAPCMALGIPVILASDNFDHRFSWIDKYLPLYTPNNFDQINWEPDPVDLEKDKIALKQHYIHRLKRAYDENSLLYDCSTILEDRERTAYNGPIVEQLRLLAPSKSVKYALWGMRGDTMNLHHIISDNLPNWELVAFIDEYSTGGYEGHSFQKSSDIPNLEQDIIFFVVPESAHEYASELLKKYNRQGYLVTGKSRFIKI